MMSRFVPYIKNLVSQLSLDLSGKVIIAELATNAYFDAALILLFAGAKSPHADTARFCGSL